MAHKGLYQYSGDEGSNVALGQLGFTQLVPSSGTGGTGNVGTSGDKTGDTLFVASEDNDIVEHMMNEHPSELNKALFKEPPPKPWLEQPFQLLLAKVYARLKAINEDRRVNQETFEEFMQFMYADLKEYFENES